MDTDMIGFPPGFLPEGQDRRNKELRYRLKRFADWTHEVGHRTTEAEYEKLVPDLPGYGVHLLEEGKLAPGTVRSHLSTIRARYKALMQEASFYRWLQGELANSLTGEKLEATFTEILQSIEMALVIEIPQPGGTPTEDKDQEERVRLTVMLLVQLLTAPTEATLVGMRDRAMIGLAFGCGLREYELCSLKVDDLGDGLWLHVPEGFGCEERTVSFAEFIWARVWVNDWLDSAKIREGYIFRGFYRSEGMPTASKVRPKPLSPRTFEKILARYPLKTERENKYTVRPMDLRKAYARLLYEARIDLPEIQLRLGLRDANAVLDYIGGQEADLGVPWDRDVLEYFDDELRKALEVKRMTGDDRSRKGP